MTTTISGRFRDAVQLHLARNLNAEAPHWTPLLMGIHGRPGEGKTFQLRKSLEQLGVKTVLLSGGQMESKDAGEPGERLRIAYIEAGVAISGGYPAAVVLNDIDAAIGNWGALTQYTVNTQNVVTELMHLCDYPTRVDGRDTRRVPIFLTGNDFTRIYGPLRRHGRMDLFRWELSRAEKVEILRPVLIGVRDENIDLLIQECPEFSLASWVAVAARVHDQRTARFLARSDVPRLLRDLLNGTILRGGDEVFDMREIAAAIEHLKMHKAEDLVST